MAKRKSKAEREEEELEQFRGTYEGYEIPKLESEMAEVVAQVNKLDADKAAFLSGYRSKTKHLKKRLGRMSDLLEEKKAEQ